MKRHYLFIFSLLIFALLIYLIYRNEKTVINILFEHLFGKNFFSIRSVLKNLLPLPDYFIYCLPGGLWVLASTILSKKHHFYLYRYRLNLAFAPMAYTLILEILQFFEVAPGRFDILDVLSSILFGIIGGFLLKNPSQTTVAHFNLSTILLIFIYGIVYLSHIVS